MKTQDDLPQGIRTAAEKRKRAGSRTGTRTAIGIALLWLIAATLHAADPIVLIRNLDTARSGNLPLNVYDVAGPFTTGGESGGYSLTQVNIDLQGGGTRKVTLEIWSANSDGSPRAKITEMSGPQHVIDGINQYTGNVKLEQGTSYHVVVYRTPGSSSFPAAFFSSLTTDDTSLADWSLPPRWHRLSNDMTWVLSELMPTTSLRFELKGLAGYTRPEQPRNVAADATTTEGEVRLSWTGVGTVTGHRIERQTGREWISAKETGPEKEATIGTLGGQKHKFRVIAINGDKESEPSGSVEVTTPGGSFTGTMKEGPFDDVNNKITVDLEFSETVQKSVYQLRDHALAITNGSITEVRRLDRGRRTVRGRSVVVAKKYRLVLNVPGGGATTITLAQDAACGTPAAVCSLNDVPLDSDIRVTLSETSLQMRQITLSIQSTLSVNESNRYATLEVSTSESVGEYNVCADYETGQNTASANVDFVSTEDTVCLYLGDTLTWIHIPIIDDDIDDPGEKFLVRLKNARLIHPYTEQRIRSFHIRQNVSLVTIENSDAMPVAMIARMGRAAAGQVVEQIEQRVEDRRTPGIQGRVGNREINATTAQAIVRDLANGISGPGAQQQNMLNRSPGAMNEPIGAAGQPAGSIAETAFGHGPIGAGTSFQLNRQTGREGSVAFWSRSATTSFNGTDAGMSLNGDVDTRMFGADYARKSWILGVAVGNSHGVGDYRGEGAGRLESSVRGFYPWIGYRPTERISVWAVSGYGTGHIRLQAERGTPIETPMSMAMVASGARGQLTSPTPDGFSLAFKTDSLWVGTNTHAVSGQSGRLAAANASISRVRTGIEATRPTRLGEHTTLLSNLEVALRHDMGDAETGTGMDVGAGITLADQRTGLSINVQMRTLMVHQVEDFQERGFAVSISYDPTPGTPTGLMATVSPTWGGDATMNGQALWNQSASQMTPMDPTSNGSGINSEIGYGLPVGRQLVGTPTMGISQSAYGRVYHLGYNLATLTHEGLSLQAGIDAQRRQIRGLDGIDHSIGARTTIGW